MRTQNNHPVLRGRGVAVVEMTHLPALLPDAWGERGSVMGVRLMEARVPQGKGPGFLVVSTENPPAAIRTLAQQGADHAVFIGTCASPNRDLAPGDVLLVDEAHANAGTSGAHPELTQHLAERCAAVGLEVKRGSVASGVRPAGKDVAQDLGAEGFLRAARENAFPAGALLVCTGSEGPERAESPGAMLRAFEAVYGVLTEALRPEPPGRPSQAPAAAAPAPADGAGNEAPGPGATARAPDA